MPTSKLPNRDVMVPATVIAFGAERPKVGVNLRYEQRTPEEQRADRYREDDRFVYDKSAGAVIADLRPGMKFLMLFQGYGDKRLGVACVELTGGYGIGSNGCVRLDFKRPVVVKEIQGELSNFWAPFILAIMVVDPATEVFCEEDDLSGSKFIEHATRLYP